MNKVYKLKLRLHEKIFEVENEIEDGEKGYFIQERRLVHGVIEDVKFKGYIEYKAKYLHYIIDVAFYKYKHYLKYVASIKDLEIVTYKINDLNEDGIETGRIRRRNSEFEQLKRNIVQRGRVTFSYKEKGSKDISNVIECYCYCDVLKMDKEIIEHIKDNNYAYDFLDEIRKTAERKRKENDIIRVNKQYEKDLYNREKYGRCVECGEVKSGEKCNCEKG